METKFRAWDKKRKKMIYANDDSEYQIMIYMDGSVEAFIREIRYGEKRTWCEESESFILMQYTDLKDKNVKDIYEGDIIRTYLYNDKWDNGAIGDVSFRTPSFRFSWKILLAKNGEFEKRNPITTICSSAAYDSSSRDGEIEIIGNIYQNPELLK